MKAKDRPRFHLDTLRKRAGEKVFGRGEAYYRDGQVVLFHVGPVRVVAQVAGTDDYRTELTGRDKKFGGECSCPAFEDWGFCKHMVATALAANAAGPDAETTGAGTLARIRDHLRRKGIDALIEMMVEMAERDSSLFHKLDIASAAAGADDKTLEARLRKAIDRAMRIPDFIEYREAAGWAAEVDAVLDAIAGLATTGRADLALKLAELAIDRIGKAIPHIDDSDGHCGALLDRARDIHLGAARTARPDPLALAGNLFEREMADEYDTFHAAAPLYADVLGEDGLGEYRRLATAAWEKLPPRRAGRAHDKFADDYGRLADILDYFAERASDVETRIALRAKDLSSPWQYLQLAEFCREQGREEEALRRAEEGLWMFEDDPLDERLLFLVVDLLTKAGRKNDAEECLWRAFEKAPSFELYARLRKAGGQAARERAIRFLQGWIVKEKRSQWHYPADLLVRILTHEKMYDAAWTTVREYQASRGAKEALAGASEASHPREALETYAARVEELARGGGNQAYAEAVKLIARMAKLCSPKEHTVYMLELKARHGRKRNFMKLLA